MRTFYVCDLTAKGEVRSLEPYDYVTLERLPGCLDLIANFSNRLYQHPEEFETALTAGRDPVTFRWRATAATATSAAGVATVRAGGRTASLSLLVTGLDPTADETTLQAFQTHLARELHDTGWEAAFHLMSVTQRPLVATLTLAGPDDESGRLTVALADRCFAAAYFRYHQLA